jgi:hypothetical protein
MEHAPSVTAIEPAELMEFCAEAGYTYRLESHGSLLIPPDYNVGMTDWERSMRLRCRSQTTLGCLKSPQMHHVPDL